LLLCFLYAPKLALQWTVCLCFPLLAVSQANKTTKNVAEKAVTSIKAKLKACSVTGIKLALAKGIIENAKSISNKDNAKV